MKAAAGALAAAALFLAGVLVGIGSGGPDGSAPATVELEGAATGPAAPRAVPSVEATLARRTPEGGGGGVAPRGGGEAPEVEEVEEVEREVEYGDIEDYEEPDEPEVNAPPAGAEPDDGDHSGPGGGSGSGEGSDSPDD